MKLLTMLAFATLCTLCSTVARAADRSYTIGTVWDITYIQTEPGHFDDYLDNLAANWQMMMEAQKKDGTILSYKIIASSKANPQDWDLMLMVEMPNYASLDKGPAYFDALMAKVLQSSREKAAAASKDRGKLRTVIGSKLGQELKFN
ncbi:MAG: hypothetical protein R3241_07295 [Rheinheimera sp.]|nr:hypothetical protein [Rheinheimera sp.]